MVVNTAEVPAPTVRRRHLVEGVLEGRITGTGAFATKPATPSPA